MADKFDLDAMLAGVTPDNLHEETVTNVLAFHPVEVGEGYRFDPDKILEAAKGQDFTNVVIIGELPDGTTWVSSAANAGEALILMERAKKQIVFGE